MMRRVLGVFILVVLAGGATFYVYKHFGHVNVCEVCNRPLHHETRYRVQLSDGEEREICCPRCGLRFQEGRQDIASAEVVDYPTGENIDATKAYYVEGSEVHPCSMHLVKEDRQGSQYQMTWDRCLPSLVAFGSRESAEDFQATNGGVVKTYRELLEEGS